MDILNRSSQLEEIHEVLNNNVHIWNTENSNVVRMALERTTPCARRSS